MKREKYDEVNQQIGYLLTLVQRTRLMKLTSIEYAYLKTIAFTATDMPNLTGSAHARHVNAQSCQELYEHILALTNVSMEDSISENDGASSGQPSHAALTAALDRYSQLLQLLPCLRWFKQPVLVELFFSGLIGSLSIETVVPFILNMDVTRIFEHSSCGESLPGAQSLANILHH